MSWKKSNNRQTLFISGIRNVGKTNLVNQFGLTYTKYIRINLENIEDKKLFNDHNDLSSLLIDLFFRENKNLDHLSETLLFIDEIQNSKKALSLLKNLDMSLKQLHIIVASSIINSSTSPLKILPIGKIRYLHVHPLNFQEFLEAHQQVELLEHLAHHSLNKTVHQSAINWFYKYLFTGGMPAIVRSSLEGKSNARLRHVFKKIWMSLQNDISHIAKNKTDLKIMFFILNNAHASINQRISFKNFAGSNFNSREVSFAFNQLDKLGMLRLLKPTCSTAPPVDINELKKPILQYFDTGMLAYLIRLQSSNNNHRKPNTLIQKELIRHCVYQELIASQNLIFNKPAFWVRQKRQSNAKVDFVKNYKGLLIPIVVSQAAKGRLKSLHQYIEATNHIYAVRIFEGELDITSSKTSNGKKFVLMNLPYYFISYLDDYLDHLLEEKIKL